jgi:hypothetical protein
MNEKIMLYSERAKLAKEYEEWVNKPLEDGSKIKDCPLSVITFMIIQGFSKIPEGAVVLTNDEWARLRNLEINYDDAYEDYLKYEIENQQLKKQVAELEEQRDRQAYIAEELIQEKHRWTEQARKETVKECANWLDNEKGYCGLGHLLKKQFGVEE